MSTYRPGQRVRIEWPDDDAAMEGRLIARSFTALVEPQLSLAMPDAYYALENLPGDCVITILSEPRPDEPTGLGAVVEATLHASQPRSKFVRCEKHEDAPWGYDGYRWDQLEDPVVLSEGWNADE